jgi:hypothetical protein
MAAPIASKAPTIAETMMKISSVGTVPFPDTDYRGTCFP